MKNEPDIVKQLKEAEKLGAIQDSLQGTSEELELQEKSSEDAPDDSVSIFKEDVEKTEEKDSTIVRELKKEKRYSGVSVIGDISWGTHLCQFYKTKEDLLDILVPYFKAGLENNEFCIWITSDPLSVDDAKAALEKVVQNLEYYMKKGQIEILNYSQWYTKSNKFDAEKVLSDWVKKEKQALKNGFDGLRLTGNTFWIEKQDWKAFKDYETKVNRVIGNYHMLAICSYSLEKCGSSELFDVISNHQFALIKRNGKWEIIESSERKRADEALQESEEKFRSLVETTSDWIWMVDKNGVYTYVSPKVKDILGYNPEEVIGKTPFDFMLSEEVKRIGEKFSAIVASKKPFANLENVNLHKDKRQVVLETSGIPVLDAHGDLLGYRGIDRDITERKKAEEEIRYLKDYNESILESNPNPIMVVKGKQIEYINKSFISTFGETKNEYIAKNLKDAISPEVFLVFEDLLQDGGKTKELKFRGKDFIVHSFVVKKAEEEKKRKGLLFQDITERKQAEMAIEKSTKRYRELIEGSRDGYVMTDMDDKITEYNSMFKRMIGYTDEELHKKTLRDMTPLDWHSIDEKIVKDQLLKNGYSEVYEKEIIGRDGRIFPVELRKYLIKDDDKPVGIWSFVRDITDRKKTEDELKEKVNTLEKYKNITVGRELKIIELKEKVKKLEKQLETRNA